MARGPTATTTTIRSKTQKKRRLLLAEFQGGNQSMAIAALSASKRQGEDARTVVAAQARQGGHGSAETTIPAQICFARDFATMAKMVRGEAAHRLAAGRISKAMTGAVAGDSQRIWG